MKTQLKDRILWIDGVSEVPAKEVLHFLERGLPASHIAVPEVTPDLVEFNKVSSEPLLPKTDVKAAFPPAWILPEPYASLDVKEHLITLAERISPDALYERRVERLVEEIDLFLELGYADLLRALTYVVDELTKRKIVWGVGRGSSCSSYLLYLLGLHEVDPVKYDIPLSDFLRREP